MAELPRQETTDLQQLIPLERIPMLLPSRRDAHVVAVDQSHRYDIFAGDIRVGFRHQLCDALGHVAIVSQRRIQPQRRL